jgi:hypothetical protein
LTGSFGWVWPAGILVGIIANLLTPLAKPVWTTFLTLLRYGRKAALRNEISNAKVELERFKRYRDKPSQDLAVYLSRWTLGILAVLSFGTLCAFLAEHSTTASLQMRSDVLQFAMVSFLLAVVLSLVPLLKSTSLTSAGIHKRILVLEGIIAKLNKQLEPDTKKPPFT